MSAWWNRWSTSLSARAATVLELRGGDTPALFDPLRQRTWDISDLQACPKQEWPVTPWDIRIGLAWQQVLCIPPMPGLHEDEYPAYWQNVFQRAFPEHAWVISKPDVLLNASTLVTAWPHTLAEALKPFDVHIKWCRPAWSQPLAQVERQLNSLQRARLVAWIWEEGSRMLWLQRHENAQQGWKKAVIRIIPEDAEERHQWFQSLLEREALETSHGALLPVILHVNAADFERSSAGQPVTLLSGQQNGWMIYTASPSFCVDVDTGRKAPSLASGRGLG